MHAETRLEPNLLRMKQSTFDNQEVELYHFFKERSSVRVELTEDTANRIVFALKELAAVVPPKQPLVSTSAVPKDMEKY